MHKWEFPVGVLKYRKLRIHFNAASNATLSKMNLKFTKIVILINNFTES